MDNHAPLHELFKAMMIGMVRQDMPDLSARQMAVILICCLDGERPTVRGLAARLAIPRPGVTRALDRLEHLGLTVRVPDGRDRRSVLAEATSAGHSFVLELVALMAAPHCHSGRGGRG